MTIEEELVTKSRNVSAGRLRERFEENDRIKALKVWRQVDGKMRSEGINGEYHHLTPLAVTKSHEG